MSASTRRDKEDSRGANTHDDLPNWHNNIDDAALVVIGIFNAIGVAIAAVLLCCGAWEFGKAGMVFFGWFGSEHTSESSKHALELAIHGLEFMLLAPLPYFLMKSLRNYTWDLKHEDEPTPEAKASLLGVKALIVSLLIGVVATDIIGKILSERELKVETTIFELVLLMLLGAYFFGLEKCASSHLPKKDSTQNG